MGYGGIVTEYRYWIISRMVFVKVSAAGMGSSLASGSQTLGYIEFRMDDLFEDYQTVSYHARIVRGE